MKEEEKIIENIKNEVLNLTILAIKEVQGDYENGKLDDYRYISMLNSVTSNGLKILKGSTSFL